MKKVLLFAVAAVLMGSTFAAHAEDYEQDPTYQEIQEGKIEAAQIDNQEIAQMDAQIAFMSSQNKLIDQLIQKAGEQDGALQQSNLGQISTVANDLLSTAIQARKSHNVQEVQSSYNEAVNLQKNVIEVQHMLGN